MKNLTIIKIQNAQQIFTYTGNILEDKDDFILFKDIKNHELKLNKRFIISIEDVKGDSE